MLVHVHDFGVPAVATSGISPGGVSILPKPDLECVEEGAVRIVWIHGDTLVVPVLIVIASAAATVEQSRPRRTLNLGPSGSAISGTPCRKFATSAAAARLGFDCL